MNTDHTVHVHCLEGLVVVIDETKNPETDTIETVTQLKGELTARGDELEEASKLLKVAEVLEHEHMEDQADRVKEHVRDLVAKQLNEFDGFDR